MTKAFTVLAASLFAIAAVLVPAAPAQAATLEPVEDFGSNPGNLQLYHYAPDDVGENRPVVVLLHGCSQDAATYHEHSGWDSYADRWNFTLLYAQQPGGNNVSNCFNWFQPGDQTRGEGEPQSIAQMAQYAVDEYNADGNRVFVSGLSAGGAMSAVMLATYPDLFAGGSVVAGVPYQCATDIPSAYSCMSPGVDKTPQQWGDLARNGYPGYTGERPRVAVWHGDADSRVVPANSTESVQQWTDVAGVGDEPTATDDLPGNTVAEQYGDDVVRRYTVAGIGHGTPVDPGTADKQCGVTGTHFLDSICSTYYDASYFGLNA